jgi:nitrous oxidase accessory protein NosD
MYKLSIREKSPILFNSLEEFMNELIEDNEFADSLFENHIMLQKIDNPNIFYDIKVGGVTLSSNKQNVTLNKTSKEGFTMYWKQNNTTEPCTEYYYLTLFEWKNENDLGNNAFEENNISKELNVCLENMKLL